MSPCAEDEMTVVSSSAATTKQGNLSPMCKVNDVQKRTNAIVSLGAKVVNDVDRHRVNIEGLSERENSLLGEIIHKNNQSSTRLQAGVLIVSMQNGNTADADFQISYILSKIRRSLPWYSLFGKASFHFRTRKLMKKMDIDQFRHFCEYLVASVSDSIFWIDAVARPSGAITNLEE